MNEFDHSDASRLEDRLERGFAEVRQDIRDLGSKFDSRLEKQDDRLRAVEQKLYWFSGVGAVGGVLVGVFLRKLGL